MNAKQTALDVYLARTVTIRAKPERLQQLADDHFGHEPDATSIGTTSATSGRWRLGWMSAGDRRRR